MKHSAIYALIYLLSLLPFTQSIAHTGWNSFIVNFDKRLYGKGTQTWQIAPYDSKWIYFANKNGMLQFDGSNWDVFPLHN